jgi:hypothetical protein
MKGSQRLAQMRTDLMKNAVSFFGQVTLLKFNSFLSVFICGDFNKTLYL